MPVLILFFALYISCIEGANAKVLDINKMYSLSDQDTISSALILNKALQSSVNDTLLCKNLFIANHIIFDNVDSIRCRLIIFNSTILGSLRARNTVFVNGLDLSFSTINYISIIDSCTFKNELIFFKSNFKDDLKISYSNCDSVLVLEEARFGGIFHINQSIVNFFIGDNVVFDKNVIVQETKFKSTAIFDNSHFKSKADFVGANFTKGVSFFKTRFDEYGYFYSNFKYICDIGESVFYSNADFRYAKFDSLNFFISDNITCQRLLIHWDQISGKIGFINTKRPQGIRGYRDTYYSFRAAPYEDVINVYLMLEDNFRKIGRPLDADSCYYAMKYYEEKHNNGNNKLTSLWLCFLRNICDYGINPFKILLIIPLIMFLMACIHFVFYLSYKMVLWQDNETLYYCSFSRFNINILKVFLESLIFNITSLVMNVHTHENEVKSTLINQLFSYIITGGRIIRVY